MADGSTPFDANRILSWWTPWDPDHLVDHVAALRPQVLQIGHFGPLLYSLGHTEHFDYFGVPVRGIDEQHDWWRQLIGQVQDLGVQVVGLISLGYFFGDHEADWGWFRFWEALWDEDRLGPRPCDDPLSLVQVDEQGRRKITPRGAETRNWYNACLSNPDWTQTLKAMVKQGVEELGLDGFNTVYNYGMGCCCEHCQAALRTDLADHQQPAELRAMGIEELAEHRFDRIPASLHPDGPGSRLDLACARFTHRRLKAIYDDIFLDFGRSLKPDLLAATWFHNYGPDNFGQLGNDERSGLGADQWARGEDYIWYCLGRQEHTEKDLGHLADHSLECRYLRAAADGKRFIPNRYDERRLGLYAAESVAAGGAAIGWHWDTGSVHSQAETDRYTAELGGLFLFVRDHDACYRDVASYADCALVFPRASVLQGYTGFGRLLRRWARRLADGHILFDVVIDDRLADIDVDHFRTVMLCETICCSDATLQWLDDFVAAGGLLLRSEASLTRDENGRERDLPTHMPRIRKPVALEDASPADRSVVIGAPPDDETQTERGHGTRWVGPPPERDVYGARMMQAVRGASTALRTTAPWTALFHVFEQREPCRLLVHVLNFDNDESSEVYLPIATPSFELDLALPPDARVTGVSMAVPWTTTEVELDSTRQDGRVSLSVPAVEIYGLLVLRLE
jgi:hypothetical protein